MKTYVINLESAKDRREYMRKLLTKFPILDVEFVEAVDGRKMSLNELEKIFDYKAAYKTKSRFPSPPEIGCTLSHIKCYNKLLKSRENFALILEDDIDSPSNDFYLLASKISKFISTERPQIILLSDWFWYTTARKLYKNYDVVKVRNAFLTHAYIINAPAAKIITSRIPGHIADDWMHIKKLGIEVLAIKPHLIHQQWTESFKSSIQIKNDQTSLSRPTLSLQVIALENKVKFLTKRIFLLILKLIGHYYPPHGNKSKWEKAVNS